MIREKKSMKKKVLRNVAVIALAALLVGAVSVLALNGYVKSLGAGRILSAEDAARLDGVDCILVLGCKVRDDGKPSDMLNDRLTCGIELYAAGVAPKLLMSGDHGRTDYNEVGTMKRCAVDAGVPSSDVFMDHAGFSTYESVYRAKEIFCARKIVIVTQEYHLYRALYIAEKLGVEAYGVASDRHTYGGQTFRECREILARCKDFATSLFKPEPTYLGDAIPISGDGDLTND